MYMRIKPIVEITIKIKKNPDEVEAALKLIIPSLDYFHTRLIYLLYAASLLFDYPG